MNRHPKLAETLPEPSGRSPLRRVTTALLVASTVAAAAVILFQSWSGPPTGSFWFWLAACFLAELLWVRLPFDGATLSMASCANFAAILLLSRGEAMAVAAVSVLVAELVIVRKPWQRAIFNSAQTSLAVGWAALVYSLLGGQVGNPVAALSDPVLTPIVLAAVIYSMVNTGMVSLAISLNQGISVFTAWRRNYANRFEFLSNGALFSLGTLLAVLYSIIGPMGMALVLLPVLVTHEGYRRMSNPSTQMEEKSAKAA